MSAPDGLLAEIRRKAIAELVDERGSISAAELCEHFGVSPATVRNDLRDLEALRMLDRTHGGAIRCRTTVYEPNTEEKSVCNIKEKTAIARAALKHIRPGDAIALDSGTTTYRLAKLLAGFEELTVITYDLQIAAYLESSTNVTVFMAGGSVRRGFHCTCGQSTIDAVSRLRADTLFLATNALHTDGLSTPSLEMAGVKSALISCADRVVLLADSLKFNRHSFARFAEPRDIDILITDAKADERLLASYREAGVKIEQV